jgi:hypothetical protein
VLAILQPWHSAQIRACEPSGRVRLLFDFHSCGKSEQPTHNLHLPALRLFALSDGENYETRQYQDIQIVIFKRLFHLSSDAIIKAAITLDNPIHLCGACR